MAERAIIVCSRPMPGRAAVAGSTLMPCDRCGVDVVMSPSSVIILANDAEVVCGECIAPELHAEPEVRLEMTSDQRAELIANGVPESKIDELLEQLGVTLTEEPNE